MMLGFSYILILELFCERIARCPEVRVVIICGSGDRAFSAGSDIGEFTVVRDDVVAMKLDPENRALDAKHLATETTEHWRTVSDTHGVWNAPVKSYAEVVADPQLVANHSIIEFETESTGVVRLLGDPLFYDGEPVELRQAPPELGQHTDEVLSELGLGAEDVARLRNTSATGRHRATASFAPASDIVQSVHTNAGLVHGPHAD